MVLGCKIGQMAQSMLGIGKMIGRTGKENSIMLQEIFMKASGKTIKLMEKVFITRRMEENTKENGLKINNMDMELKLFLTAQNIRVIS